VAVARSKRFGLDTSVVLRLIVGEPEPQADRAARFLTEALDVGDSLIVSDLVLCETYFALHTHYDVPKREAIKGLTQMLTEGPVTAVDGSPILNVLKASAKGPQKPGFVDRLIQAQYEALQADTVSFEKASRRLPRTRVL
jgi:predicted nucleic acid-binding protein